MTPRPFGRRGSRRSRTRRCIQTLTGCVTWRMFTYMNSAEGGGGAALLTTEDVAARLNIRPATVRGWIRNGDLEATNIGGQRVIYRISEDALRKRMEWLASYGRNTYLKD